MKNRKTGDRKKSARPAWSRPEQGEFVTLREAGDLLTANIIPIEDYRTVPGPAKAIIAKLKRAIISGKLLPFAAYKIVGS